MPHDDNEAKGKAIGAKARAKKLSADKRAEIAKKAAEARWSRPQTPREDRPQLLSKLAYERKDAVIVEIEYDQDEKEIWATQEEIAALFDVTKQNVGQHLKNIFGSDELAEDAVVKKSFITAADGKNYLTLVYSLDAIIAVGYRVSSKEATRFRQWSGKILRTYLEQGYVINEKALRESPDKLNKLAAEVRAIRASEKQVYAKVRECFKVSASDYHPEAGEVRRFYILLQEKFHHAVTGMTSSKIVLDRADHTQENVGLQTMSGKNPTIADVETGKNYLKQEELYRLHLLSEQFLLYAESTALAKRKMTMSSLHQQLDRLLTLNDYPVFDGYKDYIKDEAVKHARQELIYYRKRKKLEALGIKYDPEALAYGEYDDILMEEAGA